MRTSTADLLKYRQQRAEERIAAAQARAAAAHAKLDILREARRLDAEDAKSAARRAMIERNQAAWREGR